MASIDVIIGLFKKHAIGFDQFRNFIQGASGSIFWRNYSALNEVFLFSRS